MRAVNLFSGPNVDDSMAGDSDSTSPKDAGGKAGDLSMTPSFDLNLSSVEERVAGLKLAGDATTASPPGANASGMGDDNADVTPPGGDAADVDLAVGESASSPTTGEGADGTAPACVAALAQKQWLEPPSPAVAPRSSAGAAAAAATADSGIKRASLSPKYTTEEAAPSAEVSPYGARGKLGGGLSTSSTFGPSSDDQDDDFMATEFAAGAGVGAPVAEMTLPSLPKVEETLPGQQQLQQREQEPAPPAAVDGEGGVDGAAAPCASDGVGGSVDAESSVILDEMLVAATGGGLGCASRAGMKVPPPGAGAGPSTAAAADKGKGGTVVVSAVEKEAMALAAACVAQQEALNKAPEAAEAAATGADKKAAGVEREGGNQEPEIAGGESGGDNARKEGKKAPAAVPGKQAVGGGGAEAKLGGGGMKSARVSISHVAVPAAVSARRGSTTSSSERRSSLRPPSPSRSNLRPPSPSRSSLRPASPSRNGSNSLRPPSPSVRPPSPSRGSALRPPSPSATQRRHSMAFGSRVDAGSGSAAAAAVAAVAKRTAAVTEATKEKAAPKAKTAPVVTVPVKRASSRGRDRVVRERTSVGGVSRGRNAGTSAGGAAPAGEAFFFAFLLMWM